MGIGTEDVKRILLQIAHVIEENKEYLTELDAAIGDGDHGINMSKGFKQVEIKLNALDPDVTVGDLFKATSTTLISHVGGASGPLYGTLFMKAAAVMKDKRSVDLQDLDNILREGVAGIKMRGKAEKGEKTMLDVLIPVLETLDHGLAEQVPAKAVIENALAAAKEGVEYTKTIKATKGRASYLGDRSIGHIDPGAMSSCLMIGVIHDVICG